MLVSGLKSTWAVPGVLTCACHLVILPAAWVFFWQFRNFVLLPSPPPPLKKVLLGKYILHKTDSGLRRQFPGGGPWSRCHGDLLTAMEINGLFFC